MYVFVCICIWKPFCNDTNSPFSPNTHTHTIILYSFFVDWRDFFSLPEQDIEFSSLCLDKKKYENLKSMVNYTIHWTHTQKKNTILKKKITYDYRFWFYILQWWWLCLNRWTHHVLPITVSLSLSLCIFLILPNSKLWQHEKKGNIMFHGCCSSIWIILYIYVIYFSSSRTTSNMDSSLKSLNYFYQYFDDKFDCL